jgi:hypothetical protein
VSHLYISPEHSALALLAAALDGMLRRGQESWLNCYLAIVILVVAYYHHFIVVCLYAQEPLGGGGRQAQAIVGGFVPRQLGQHSG